MATRLTISLIAEASARSVFMNFRRAGVAKNRSRTSAIVPLFIAAGRGPSIWPPFTLISKPESACAVRDLSDSRDTEPMEGRASPRKPSARMSCTSSVSFDVQWRETANVSSSEGMPEPLSVMRMRFLPPPAVTTSMRVAPASMAFSTSSFTTLAGRSITSPAAIWLMMVSVSCLMAMPYI